MIGGDGEDYATSSVSIEIISTGVPFYSAKKVCFRGVARLFPMVMKDVPWSFKVFPWAVKVIP